MNRAAQIYCIFVVAIATVVLGTNETWSALPALTTDQALALVTLVALGIFSEALGFEVSIGKIQSLSSIAFIPFIAAVFIFPSPYQLIVTGVAYGVGQTAIHRKPAIRAAFNIAQVLISMSLATAVFEAVGGEPGQLSSVTILNFAAFAATLLLTNQLIVSAALALMSRERFTPTFLRIISVSGGNLLYDLLVSPIAAAVALLYVKIGVGGIFLIFFPLLLVRHAYATILKLQSANKDVLQVLVKTIETRDPYTSGHSLRVAALARAIAEDLKFSPFKVDMIETAAMVHDIGKIDLLYADLIGKESGLTEAERRVIMTHAAKGAEFLRTLSSLPESVVLAVRHHHERYDGTGYPDRLTGEEIPLASRIIMLCDSVDAMLSDRPYRHALNVDQVRAELLRCSGSQFDPRIVQIMLKRNTLERAASLVTPGIKKPALSVAV